MRVRWLSGPLRYEDDVNPLWNKGRQGFERMHLRMAWQRVMKPHPKRGIKPNNP